MGWEKNLNSFVFVPSKKILPEFDNYKINSTVCDLNYSLYFPLDDITNISYDISLSYLGTSIISSNNNNDFKLHNEYLKNVKILVSIRIEYKNNLEIKFFNLTYVFGDFLICCNKDSTINISPELICLWKSSDNKINLTFIYVLIENSS
ncbi:hypothetical protein [Clostridium weizhouense]|uniref:Uncharacterized protein n=1 Tax=Clostridium weizhouense TaxID=2859781 RepID=A0ABS7AKT9_9CLOT|nr:hypothetical protein [Clostridium weizhouense]MBW6409263.1 hypothetical protein [Clostridium weizhouense]